MKQQIFGTPHIDVLIKNTCESFHLEYPKQICPMCHEKYCGHCQGEPMKHLDQIDCEHCDYYAPREPEILEDR